MKWVYTSVNEICKKVFAEVAKLSYEYEEGDLSEMEKIQYRVIPGEISRYRESVFLERAIVKERMASPWAFPYGKPLRRDRCRKGPRSVSNRRSTTSLR